MGLAELQGALAKLYIDPKLRDRFFAAPVVVVVELGLDLEEARGLARIPRRQVEQFADSLRHKRRDQVRRVVPIAARAIGGDRFAELFERYATESAPRGSRADLDDAIGFVEAIRQSADQVEPPWAVDLARYELAWRQAARGGRAPIARVFRFSVAKLAIGRQPDPVAPRPTLALWWRPTRHGAVRHIVVTLPTLRVGRKSRRPAS
jgi:hypothetical protein